MASGSGRVTVVSAGSGALPGREAVWQPAKKATSRPAKNNRRKDNTRRILLTDEGDTSPLSQRQGLESGVHPGTILPAGAPCRHIPRAMNPICRGPHRECFPPPGLSR
jgi:hypothetical protein